MMTNFMWYICRMETRTHFSILYQKHWCYKPPPFSNHDQMVYLCSIQ